MKAGTCSPMPRTPPREGCGGLELADGRNGLAALVQERDANECGSVWVPSRGSAAHEWP